MGAVIASQQSSRRAGLDDWRLRASSQIIYQGGRRGGVMWFSQTRNKGNRKIKELQKWGNEREGKMGKQMNIYKETVDLAKKKGKLKLAKCKISIKSVMLIMLFCLKVLQKLKMELDFIVVFRLPYKLWWQKKSSSGYKNIYIWKAMKLLFCIMQRAPGLCQFVILVLRCILLSINKSVCVSFISTVTSTYSMWENMCSIDICLAGRNDASRPLVFPWAPCSQALSLQPSCILHRCHLMRQHLYTNTAFIATSGTADLYLGEWSVNIISTVTHLPRLQGPLIISSLQIPGSI